MAEQTPNAAKPTAIPSMLLRADAATPMAAIQARLEAAATMRHIHALSHNNKAVEANSGYIRHEAKYVACPIVPGDRYRPSNWAMISDRIDSGKNKSQPSHWHMP